MGAELVYSFRSLTETASSNNITKCITAVNVSSQPLKKKKNQLAELKDPDTSMNNAGLEFPSTTGYLAERINSFLIFFFKSFQTVNVRIQYFLPDTKKNHLLTLPKTIYL